MGVSKPARSHSRKVLLINPRFQLTYLGFSAALALLAVSVVFFANAFFFSRFKALGLQSGLNPDHVFFRFIAEQQAQMNWIFGITAAVVFLVLVLGGLLLSHRVAGPLHHLRRHCAEIAEGGPIRDLKFREKDFFQEIPPVFNAMLRRTGQSSENAETSAVQPPPFRHKAA